MTMQIPVIDATAFLASFKALEQKLHDYLHATWIDVIKRAEQRMYQHGYQNRTGRLTSSMKWAAGDRRAFGFWGTVTISAPYALYVDKGTRAHGPVTAKYLRFEIAGRVIYAKWVRGIKAANFSGEAVKYVEDNGPRMLQSAVDEIARRE